MSPSESKDASETGEESRDNRGAAGASMENVILSPYQINVCLTDVK